MPKPVENYNNSGRTAMVWFDVIEYQGEEKWVPRYFMHWL